MSATLERPSDIDAAVDVTTIRVTMRYPTNAFELITWDFSPHTLKVQLAFEYKLLAYSDLEFSIHYISPIDDQINTLKANVSSLSVPFLRVQYKNGVDENWLSDSSKIIKFLDSNYPLQTLCHPEDLSFNNEINMLEDWIDECFGNAYMSLLFLNDKNFRKASRKWLEGDKNFIKNIKIKLYRKNKVIQYASNFPSIKHALENAYKRFDEDLLPIICDKLEASHAKGFKFILGNEFTAADLAVYSFLRSILLLEEANLVSRRSLLLRYMDEIENIPLNGVQGNVKKGYTRQKLMLIGESGKDH
ncbi:MAG: glutathione S-transferase family protein [Candidatus Caenarcaniphilales bacterium]|nr:glutathione S-transferase family protein [Candidatus Caenarcaniphilales bacterium]